LCGTVQGMSTEAKRPTDANKPVFSVRRIGEQDQWKIPTPDSPDSWVEIVSSEPRWAGYWFRVTFRVGQVAGFDVRRDDAAPALTARRLQDIKFGAIEQCARERVHFWLTDYVDRRPAAASSDLNDWLVEFDAKPAIEPAAPSKRDEMLARLALRYSETLGDPDQAVILGDEFRFSELHIPNVIREARVRGLLSETKRGKAGGTPTVKAVRILSGEPLEQPDQTDPAEVPEHYRAAIEVNQRMKEALEAGDMKEWNRLAEESIKEAGNG
jgi:hypothetical protein